MVLRWNDINKSKEKQITKITKTKSLKYVSMLPTIHTGMLINSDKKPNNW